MDCFTIKPNAENQLIQVDGTSGTCSSPAADYVYASGQLIAEYENSTTYFVHDNNLGSSTILTSLAGAVVDCNAMYPYGEQDTTICTTSNSIWDKFTGYRLDPETGLEYAHARYYNPSLGRFMSPDPLGGSMGDPQSMNRYAYVGNNPLGFIDPSGLTPFNPLYNAYEPPGGLQAWFEELFFNASDPFGDLDINGGTWNDGGDIRDIVNPGMIALEMLWGGPSQVTHEQIIDILRGNLYDRLLQDPDCLSFLGRNGAPVLKTLATVPISEGDAGGQNVQAVTNSTLPPPGSVVPSYSTMTINSHGWFFARGGSSNISGQTFYTGTPRYQAEILLHELGHATGSIIPEGQSAQSETLNDSAVVNNCNKTLQSFAGKQ